MDENEHKKRTELILIVVSLGIVITIIAAAVLYTWALNFTGGPPQTPMVTASTTYADGNYTINISSVEPDSVEPELVWYVLSDPSNNSEQWTEGPLTSIMDLDPENEFTFISLLDRDNDSRLSRGDAFFIKHRDNGGVAIEGYRLNLTHEWTGDRMHSGGIWIG